MCSQYTNRHTPHGAATVHPGWYQEGGRSRLGWGWAPWLTPPGHLAPSAGSPSDPLVVQAASPPGTHPATKTQGSLQKNTDLYTGKSLGSTGPHDCSSFSAARNTFTDILPRHYALCCILHMTVVSFSWLCSFIRSVYNQLVDPETNQHFLWYPRD